ncbi:MAG: ABC transporter substrate-binding protein [Gemmiger sp.]|nr:ABC transporter substrate-binding protein [Gemmiger sp.]
MKKQTGTLRALVSAALALALLGGCAGAPIATPTAETATQTATTAPEPATQSTPQTAATPGATQNFTDAMGYTVTVESWARVVSLYGSFAETWSLAGGTLVGTTEDAVTERGLALGEDVAVIGSTQQPNLEEILALNPDFVILSADISEQTDLHEALAQAGIPHAYYRVDTFTDYLAMLRQFCDMTGQEALYQQNGVAVEKQVDFVKDTVQAAGEPAPTVLLLRAYSTGCKAKGADNLAGAMLAELGADNLVEQYQSLLEDVSMEEIIAADPEYILVVTMGSSQQKALDWLAQNLEANPAWAGLKAVQNGNYKVLPKDLFHYKPNARWGESYAYLATILYPSLAEKLG